MTKDARLPATEILIRIERLQAMFADGAPALEPQSIERDVVERCLEVISEASRRLPDAFRSARSEIDWRKLADLGNVLRHGYDRIEREVLVGIVEDSLPPLKLAVQALLDELDA